MKTLPTLPLSIRAAQALFIINTLTWLGIGIATFLRASDNRSDDSSIMMIVIAILMFGNAAAMLWNAWGLGKRRRLFYYCALVILAVNILLTVTDQFGLLDLITLLVDAALFILLIVDRKRYMQ